MKQIATSFNVFLTEQIQTQKLFMGVQALGLILTLVFAFYLFLGIVSEAFGLGALLGMAILISIPFLFFIRRTWKLKRAYAADLARPLLENKYAVLTKVRLISVPDQEEYYKLTFSDNSKVYTRTPMPAGISHGKTYVLSMFSHSRICYELKKSDGKVILDTNKILHHLQK